MRVLVTGAAGFIGSHVAERLQAAGHEVTGVDNLETGRRENWPDLIEESIVDRDVFYGIANNVKPDLIVHAAASYSNPDFWHRDTDTNVTGSINVAIAAKHHSARVIYFQTALPPTSSYAISKIAAEQYLCLADLPLTVFRLANVYGPRNLSGPIPTFYKRLTDGEPCTVVDTKRDMVYVDDLVGVVVEAVRLGSVRTRKFDICSGIQRPIEELYWAVASALDVAAEPEKQDAGWGDVTQMELSPEDALSFIGWQAGTIIHEGVRRTVAWYREHGVGETYSHLAAR